MATEGGAPQQSGMNVLLKVGLLIIIPTLAMIVIKLLLAS